LPTTKLPKRIFVCPGDASILEMLATKTLGTDVTLVNIFNHPGLSQVAEKAGIPIEVPSVDAQLMNGYISMFFEHLLRYVMGDEQSASMVCMAWLKVSPVKSTSAIDSITYFARELAVLATIPVISDGAPTHAWLTSKKAFFETECHSHATFSALLHLFLKRNGTDLFDTLCYDSDSGDLRQLTVTEVQQQYEKTKAQRKPLASVKAMRIICKCMTKFIEDREELDVQGDDGNHVLELSKVIFQIATHKLEPENPEQYAKTIVLFKTLKPEILKNSFSAGALHLQLSISCADLLKLGYNPDELDREGIARGKILMGVKGTGWGKGTLDACGISAKVLRKLGASIAELVQFGWTRESLVAGRIVDGKDFLLEHMPFPPLDELKTLEVNPAVFALSYVLQMGLDPVWATVVSQALHDAGIDARKRSCVKSGANAPSMFKNPRTRSTSTPTPPLSPVDDGCRPASLLGC
jgi:hypothetical protein